MRIVIDLQSCQSGSRHGGIGRYSMNLVQGMLRNSNGHDIHIVLSSLMRSGDAEIYDSLDGLISKDNIHICDVVGPVFELDPNNIFRARSSELLREYFISKLSPDIVFVTSLFEGLGDDAVVSVSRLLSGIPTVVILYDLIPLVESETYLSDARAKTHYYRKLDDLSRADILLSISEYSRFEALQELGLHPGKVENISSAIDAKFRKIDVSEAANKKLQDKYGFSKDFILYTGSFDQRKNHESLIKAYSKLPNEVRDKYQLVIVGNGWDGVYDRLKSVGLSAGLSEGDLIFVGKVEDEELLMLYNLCFLFVFPSLREGFGLPVLEAMSCGVPVIGSNATSIPEVIGNEKALFDPYSVDSISSKMLEVLTDASLRAELVEAGLIQAKKFSWDLSAKVALAACERLFASLGEQKRLPKITCNDLMNEISNLPSAQEATSEDIAALSVVIGDLFVESGVQEGKDLSCSKIGLVTPWNTKCGIAMYSKYLISNELDEYVVFAPSAQGVAFTDESNVRRCWEVGGEQLSALYESIIREGVWVVLIQFNYGFFDFHVLSEFIQKLVRVGRKVSVTLHSTTDPDPALYKDKKLKQLYDAFSLCENIFIHSANDLENLNDIDLAENVVLMPQGVYSSRSNDFSVKFRNSEFVVASYGFFLPHKGLFELIDAVHKLRESGFNISLLMLNAAYDSVLSYELISAARKKITTLGLEGKVSIVSDFLSDDLSIGLLRNSDLVVYPYQETGESSSAAVRMGLASGVPVAVTPLSIFDDVRDVVFELPGTSFHDIAEGIKMIMSRILNGSVEVSQTLSRAEQWKGDRYYPILGRRLKEKLLEL